MLDWLPILGIGVVSFCAGFSVAVRLASFGYFDLERRMTMEDGAKRAGWRVLDNDEYKSKWCTPCTGGSDKPGVWAHFERSDGFTVCGEFHKPEDYPRKTMSTPSRPQRTPR